MGSTETSTKTAGRSAEEIARAYFKAVSERDVEGMVEQWKPGCHDVLYGMADLIAPDDIRAWFTKLFTAFPDFSFEVLEVLAGETKAAVHWRATGTFDGTGDFEGIQPNGASIEIEGIDQLTVEDGKIVANRAFTNGMDTAQKLGALPPSGSAAEKAMLGALNAKTRIAAAIRRR